MATRILTANHSHYPKIGDGSGKQQLRQASHRLDRGEITREAFAEIENGVIRQVIEEQEEAGLDIVTDGQIRWSDPVSHQARRLQNVQISGLLRFFDTNCYFRQPVVSGPVRPITSAMSEEAPFLVRAARRTPKIVLTGPYTLAALSKVVDGAYDDKDELIEDYAESVAAEVVAAVKAGVKRIQIEEPALLQSPGDAEKVRQALTGLARRENGVVLELALYFGDAAPLIGALVEFPVDGVILDTTYSPGLMDLLSRQPFPMGLGLGIIDGRNTRLEDVEALVPAVKQIAGEVHGDLVLTTSSGLEYLPRGKARAKLQLLKTLKDRLT